MNVINFSGGVTYSDPPSGQANVRIIESVAKRLEIDHGFVHGIGHFTQMIWRDSKQLGCGVARCYLGTVRLWVCRYAPTGNWDGQFKQNVPKRCK